MKKVMIVVLTCMMFMVPCSAFSGSLWGMVKNSGLEKIGSKPYVIEVEGVNIRAYVFEVKEINSICISVWGDNSHTLQCKTYKEIEESEKGE